MASTQSITTVDEHIAVDYDPAVSGMLTPEFREVIRGTLRIMAHAAQQAGIDHSRVDVDGFTSPDSGRQRIVLTHWVNLDSARASQLWSCEAERYYAWIETLPARIARVAREQVGIAVAWDAPE